MHMTINDSWKERILISSSAQTEKLNMDQAICHLEIRFSTHTDMISKYDSSKKVANIRN